MKKTLKEQLERIHTLTYGQKVIKEGFLDDLFGGSSKKISQTEVDDPTKADLVSDDVKDFYDTIENAIGSGGLKQQNLGSMTYQKEVESMQIALMLLGYDLPKHGVDGLFGPETASAVSKYKTDNKIEDSDETTINESPLEAPLDKLIINSNFGPRGNGTHNGVDLAANAEDVKSPADGEVVEAGIMSDDCGGTIIIQHGGGFKTGFCHLQKINVTKGQKVKQGDVIGVSGGGPNDIGRGRSDGRHLHFTLRKDGVIVDPLEYINKSGLDLSKQPTANSITVATPEMLSKLVKDLKAKNITSDQIKQYIDTVVTGGGEHFTDLDLTTPEGYKTYVKICDNFIRIKQPNPLGITGEMMARSAKKAFERYHKFVPAELALSQLAVEGGIGNGNLESRPIKTRNPFNVGNTDDGKDIFHTDVQSGIETYYNLIADSYLGKGKTSKDLINNFVNHQGLRYAGPEYERVLNQIVAQVHKVAQGVTQTSA